MTQETILKIEELREGDYDGYKITTDKRELNVAVNNSQSCCESWGYMSSEDDLQSFVGAALLKIESVDTALNAKSDPGDIYEGTAYFVNFYTSRGMFQLAVYDSHNGYYGHAFKITEGEK
jgi:hypothetical protein